MPEIQFAVQSYQSSALTLSAQRLVNFYAEAPPPDTKSPVMLVGTPGLKSFATATSGGASRGAHVMGGVMYVVNANTLYSITAAKVVTTIGTIGTSVGWVSMAHNDASPQQLCFVDGTSGWIYDTTNGLQQITDVDFQAADFVVFVDTYFAFNKTGTGQWFISSSSDGLSYSSLDFATAEGDPDVLQSIAILHRQVILFGTETIESWFNAGSGTPPFQRNPSVFIERGLLAKRSVGKLDSALYWLGDDAIVYRDSDGSPVRISHHAMEEAIRGYATKTDAYALTYTQDGHKFYVLTFPTADVTWVFDASTELWHERSSYPFGKWRVATLTKFDGKIIAGDAESGVYGELDPETYDEYGVEIRAHAASSPIRQDGKKLSMSRFELLMEAGVGLTSGQGSDPEIWLDWSDDGGKTWSARKPKRAFGKLGEYGKRAIWRRLGSFRQRTLRVSISDPVKRRLVAANIEMSL